MLIMAEMSGVLQGINGESSLSLDQVLLSGDLPTAIELCIGSGNWSDALILASFGSPDLNSQIQKRYFEICEPNSASDLVRVIATRDWKYLVETCDLKDWESVLTTILANVTDENELESLVGTLAEKLQQSSNIVHVKNAVVCYVCIQNTNKVFEFRAKVKDFDDSALFLEVSRAISILKKAAGARACNETEVRSMFCASSVTRSGPSRPVFVSSKSGVPLMNGIAPGSVIMNPQSQWRGIPPLFNSPPYQMMAPAPVPQLLSARENQPGCSNNIGYIVSNRSIPYSNSPQTFIVRSNPPTPPRPLNSGNFCTPQRFVHPTNNVHPPSLFTNGHRFANKTWTHPSVLQSPIRSSQGPSCSKEFQSKSRALSTPPPSSNKTSGFLDRLKSPCAKTMYYQNSRVVSSGAVSFEQTIPKPELGSPVSLDSSRMSSCEGNISTPEQSYDSVIIPDSEDVGQEEDFEHFEFLRDVQKTYCTGVNAKRSIDINLSKLLAERIGFWEQKFQD